MIAKAEQGKQILVWRFEDAPEDLQSLSPLGPCDMDYIVLAPDDGYLSWLEAIDSCHEPQKVCLEDGRMLYFGGH